MTDTHADLPLLTEVADNSVAIDLPVLTEVVTEQTAHAPHPSDEAASNSPTPRALSSDEMLLLLQQLETHLETVFAGKLNNQLEQLQRLAVDLAISEFKAELPQLLHDALVELKQSDTDRQV